MKKILTILCLLLISLFSFPLYANDNKVIDEYDSLSDEEIEDLNNQIKSIIDEVNFDIVVYIAYQDNEDITALADDYFDYNDYGLGNDRDGIILCINYYYRDYTITTRGSSTISLFSDSTLDYIYDDITPCLSNDNVLGAISIFLYDVKDIAKNPVSPNDPYDYEPSKTSSSEHLEQTLLVGLGGASIISLVVFFILRGQLKTQGIKTQANTYMKDSNLNIFRSGEIFLYKTSHTQKVPRNDDHHHGGGGSSVHISSSGASHGGGGSHHF